MTSSQLHKPSRLERAWESLSAAVDRLDAAADARPPSPGPDPALQARLETAEAEAETLRRTTRDLADRVDGAIGRLKRVLGE